MSYKGYSVSFEIAGPTAMWTRPDCGDSPCSYPAPTYSAVRALFEGILWGPAIQIIPRKVELCSPPQFHSYVTNYGGPLRSPDAFTKENNCRTFRRMPTLFCGFGIPSACLPCLTLLSHFFSVSVSV